MDWDWKEFAWDSSGLELELSNDGFGAQKNGGEASVDLRLGEASSDLAEKSKSTTPDTPKNPKDSKMALSSSSSPSGSSKRTRLQNGSQIMNCLVDGCNSDLSDCREYHRRHRVCEKHSKTPVVLVGGKQQRFCQQCSRFHSLGEFDEVKRSCRKRLDGHNRRRRKPQPPSLFMAAEKFLYNYKGPRILQFGDPQTYANPIMRTMWPATVKTGAEPLSYDDQRLLYRIDQRSLLSSFSDVQHKRDKELPLLQQNGPRLSNGNETMSETPIFQPIRDTIAPPANGKGGHQKLSSDSKPGSFDSGCALYLLSTLQTQSSELSLVQSSITCPTQSPSGAVHEYSSSERSKDKPNGSVLVLDANSTNPHCNGMLRMGPDGLVENGDSLTLPFFWE